MTATGKGHICRRILILLYRPRSSVRQPITVQFQAEGESDTRR